MKSRYGDQASFYKILSSDSDDHLQLPPDFAEKYLENGNSNAQTVVLSVVLKAKSAVKWSVKYVKIKDKYFFMDGWLKFIKDNRPQMGDLLVFSLLSPPPNSSFQVTFYAPKHPLTSSVIKEEKEQIPRIRALESVQSFKSVTSSGIKEEKKQISRSRALESVKSFKSDNPFYFVTMKPTYLQNWGLYVPLSFLKRHLLSNDEKSVNCVLEVSDGRKWCSVKCRDYNTCGKLYGKSWKKFQDDNRLGVGDVCVVELINVRKKVLKVTIIRAC